MIRTVCKSKIHRATVTEANLNYTGSLTVDAELMKAADLITYEQVHVVDITNGSRLVTYCIVGEPGSGTMCINGAAARLVSAGDQIIVISYAQLSPAELDGFFPKIVMLDAKNHIQKIISQASQLQGSSLKTPFDPLY